MAECCAIVRPACPGIGFNKHGISHGRRARGVPVPERWSSLARSRSCLMQEIQAPDCRNARRSMVAGRIQWEPLLDGFFRIAHSRALEKENSFLSARLRDHSIRVQASNLDIGAGDYKGDGEVTNPEHTDNSSIEASSKRPIKPGVPYLLSIAGVLLVSMLVFSLIVSFRGGPSALMSVVAKSGFTAAFTLIFVSEIGDKTFFIAALLAMQYKKILVLAGSMGALSIMTILSVIIGRVFQSVPTQFQTTLPIGEYAAVALLTFFGLKSIKDAWDLPSHVDVEKRESSELGELVEAEELVKEKVAKKLTSPLEILSKSFSLVFFAEWGDRSMLATIALGAAQSPLGVASGAIAGHVVATSIAILGGAFLANYISERLVGFLGGILFLLFAAATLLGVF